MSIGNKIGFWALVTHVQLIRDVMTLITRLNSHEIRMSRSLQMQLVSSPEEDLYCWHLLLSLNKEMEGFVSDQRLLWVDTVAREQTIQEISKLYFHKVLDIRNGN